MSKRESIEVFAEQIAGTEQASCGTIGAEYVIGEVKYSKGGVNFFSGNTSRRGYRIAVDVRTRGAGFESFMLFGSVGAGEFLEEAKAFSEKKLALLVQSPTVREKLQALKATVLAQHAAKRAKERAALVLHEHAS